MITDAPQPARHDGMVAMGRVCTASVPRSIDEPIDRWSPIDWVHSQYELILSFGEEKLQQHLWLFRKVFRNDNLRALPHRRRRQQKK